MKQNELEKNIRKFALIHNIPYEQCRPIPKSELKNGITYQGICRNANEAIWDVDAFIYTRHKFGTTYLETINHYEDDDGYDVFVPIQITKENQNQ
jgi:hypothetical protein